MPSSILRPWTSKIWAPGQVKPNGVPRINWQHPLSWGLVAYWFDTGNGFYIDLVNGRITTKTASGGTTAPGRTVTPWGQGFKFIANLSEQADAAVGLNQAWAAPYSVACGFVPYGASSGTDACLFALVDNAGNDAFAFFAPSTTTWGLSYSNAANPFTLTQVANTFYVIVGAATGTTAQSSWINGVAQTAGTATSAFTGSGMHYTFNAQTSTYNSSSGSFCNATVFFGAAWLKRSLTQTEANLLYTDPYCLLLPPSPEFENFSSGTTTAIFGWGQTNTYGASSFSLAALLAARGTTETFGKSAAKVAMPFAASGLTETKGSAKSTVTMPVFANGMTETFGRAVVRSLMPVSAAGRTDTFGRATASGTISLKASGLTETFGRVSAGIVMPAFAAGRTDSFGRVVATLTANLLAVSGRGLTTTFGRATASLALPLNARGTTETFGRISAKVSMPFFARGLTETYGFAKPTAVSGLLAVSGQGLTKTSGQATGSFSASILAAGATMTFGAAGATIVAPLLTVSASGQTMTFGAAALSTGPGQTRPDVGGGGRHKRYTASQWAQINGWLKARRDKRKEDEAKAAAAKKLAEVEIVQAEAVPELPRKPISAKARRRLQEALAPPLAIQALAISVAPPKPTYAELRAQLKADWEAVLKAHEDAIEQEDEEAVVHLFMHMING